jgi:hypothetical protein
MQYVKVSVDKSHIITIGQRLYTESIEFIRELVNNAYDADSTTVTIKINDDMIEIKDDGSGMNMEGLTQYFTIGSQEKLLTATSPIYNRARIGQFGIGKFASLAACDSFEIMSRQGEFAASVTFDRLSWEEEKSDWELPLRMLSADEMPQQGTTIKLIGLSKKYRLEDIETRIIEGTPLKTPHFKVRLNGHTIMPRSLSGYKIPILEGTEFGTVTGEIVILPETAANTDNLGIEVKVKQVTVSREIFNMTDWGKKMSRVRGELNADFLPVTSDRSGFIRDSKEYLAFIEIAHRLLKKVGEVLTGMTQKKEGKKVSRALNDALRKVYNALALNPELSPFGALPIAGDGGEGIGGAGLLSDRKDSDKKDSEIKDVSTNEKPKKGEAPKKAKKQNPLVKRITPSAIIKKVKFGQYGVTCCVDGFGVDGPEVFSEETTIYINRDHPLYIRESGKIDSHTLNMARLITQEISLMNAPRNPRQAFERQSRLMRDALTK